MRVRGISKLSDFLKMMDQDKRACFVDTSILFSETYPLDCYNTDSELAFESLAEFAVPVFTNQNVRSEFLENHRRVLLAECLVDFYEDYGSTLPNIAGEKLKSHRTNFRRKVDEEKDTKLNAHQIKNFRELLRPVNVNEKSAWSLLCTQYLHPRIAPLWDIAELELGVNFLTSRASEKTPYLKSKLNWNDAVDLIGQYGMASADAMILNMYLCSTIPLLLTADVEMAFCVLKENQQEKMVFLPDSLAEGFV